MASLCNVYYSTNVQDYLNTNKSQIMILLINVISFSRRLSMREYDRHVVSEKDIHSIFKNVLYFEIFKI